MSLMCMPIRHWRGYMTDNTNATRNRASNWKNNCRRVWCGYECSLHPSLEFEVLFGHQQVFPKLLLDTFHTQLLLMRHHRFSFCETKGSFVIFQSCKLLLIVMNCVEQLSCCTLGNKQMYVFYTLPANYSEINVASIESKILL